MELSAPTKIVAHSVLPINSGIYYRIWDNGDVEYATNWQKDIVPQFKAQNQWWDKTNLISALKGLKKNRVYKMFHCGEKQSVMNPFFSEKHLPGGILIIFLGFDPSCCKECGFEINSRVCSNCGEWQDG